MAQQLYRKWWVILLQGVLLIILSMYIFNHPVFVLASISLWFGIFVLATGFLGILAWLVAGKAEREEMSLLWSVLSVVFGVLMLVHLLATMKTLILIFGVWMFLTGLRLSQSGWILRKVNSFGWIMLTAGVLSVLFAVLIIFNIHIGAVGISTLLGLQVLVAGVALVLLSFAEKAMTGNMNKEISSTNK